MAGAIVGVDDSKEAQMALEWAMRYAQHEHLPLTVITVVDPLIATALWDPNPQHNTVIAMTTAARAEAQRLVDEAMHHLDAGDVDVNVRAVTGHPVKELCDAAQDADVLVVGSRGAGTFSRLLLGSTSSGTAHHAPCSVMIVR